MTHPFVKTDDPGMYEPSVCRCTQLLSCDYSQQSRGSCIGGDAHRAADGGRASHPLLHTREDTHFVLLRVHIKSPARL